MTAGEEHYADCPPPSRRTAGILLILCLYGGMNRRVVGAETTIHGGIQGGGVRLAETPQAARRLGGSAKPASGERSGGRDSTPAKGTGHREARYRD